MFLTLFIKPLDFIGLFAKLKLSKQLIYLLKTFVGEKGNQTMTKSEILQALADKLGKSRKEVTEFMDAMVDLAYSVTKKEGEFTIPGLGKLLKKHRDARMGRNPATGASIQIPAKTVIKFRVLKAAKDAIL